MKKNSVDTIVLGCTHYPLVAEMIEEIMSYELQLIETGNAIAKRLLVLCDKAGHVNAGALFIGIGSTDSLNIKLVSGIIQNYTLLSS